MVDIKVVNTYGEQLEEWLGLQTRPLAVRMFTDKEALPADAQRPVRDFGHHLSVCQAFAMSRRQGATIVMFKEDNWCPYPVIGLGLAEPPRYFLEGKSILPGNRSPEGAENWARAFPRLKKGNWSGIMSSPLKTATFVPHVIVIYCNTAQLQRLLLGLAYRNGDELTCRLCSDAGCSYYVVPVMQGAEAQVSIPCGGDRRRAAARDDELVLSLSVTKLYELMPALEKLHEAGLISPPVPQLFGECPQAEPYMKLARLLGILTNTE